MESIAVSEFMSGIAEKQERLLEDLSIFQDWTERYEYVIGLGKRLDPLADEARNADHLIKGCQSQVWLDAQMNDGKVVTMFGISGVCWGGSQISCDTRARGLTQKKIRNEGRFLPRGDRCR